MRLGRGPRQLLLVALFLALGLSAAQLASEPAEGGDPPPTETCPSDGDGDSTSSGTAAFSVRGASSCEPPHKGGRGEHTGITGGQDNDGNNNNDNDDDPPPPPPITEPLPPPTLPGVPDPVPGKFNIVLTGGDVFYALPGSTQFIRLVDVKQLPFGSTIVATNGSFRVIVNNGSGNETGVFAGATFTISQGPLNRIRASQGARKLITRLTLRGGRFSRCRPPVRGRGASAARTRRRVIRRAWSVAKGRFKTRGSHAAAVVRGTTWLTQDRCDGTLIRVARGVVYVWDFLKHRRVRVTRGHTYLARR